MSYLQITTPDGQLRGLKFNQGALIDFQSLVDLNNLKATSGYALLYAGLKANCFVKREELTQKKQIELNGKMQWVDVPVTFEDVCDWADQLPDEVFDEISKAFQSSLAYEKLMKQKELSDEEKKSVINTEENTEPTATV